MKVINTWSARPTQKQRYNAPRTKTWGRCESGSAPALSRIQRTPTPNTPTAIGTAANKYHPTGKRRKLQPPNQMWDSRIEIAPLFQLTLGIAISFCASAILCRAASSACPDQDPVRTWTCQYQRPATAKMIPTAAHARNVTLIVCLFHPWDESEVHKIGRAHV